MIELRITPLGPARFGIRHVSTPAVASRDDTWIAPPPSTVLGALGEFFGVKITCGPCPDRCTQAAEEALAAVAKELGIRMIWGPLVVKEGKLGIPTLDFIYYLDGAAEKIEKRARLGLALTEQKTAKPGHLYRATYIYPRNVTYVYYVDGLTPFKPRTVRLGGEGRSALVEAVETSVKPPLQIAGTAVLTTPLLAPDGEIPPCLKPVGTLKADGDVELKVKIIQWGLGFSEVCRERRPMYLALPPGTVVEANNCPPTTGHMAQAGYGALHPQPPKQQRRGYASQQKT